MLLDPETELDQEGGHEHGDEVDRLPAAEPGGHARHQDPRGEVEGDGLEARVGAQVTGLVAEQLLEQGYLLCIIDPEGDYVSLGQRPRVVLLGGDLRLPEAAAVPRILRDEPVSIVLSLAGMSNAAQVKYVDTLLPELQACAAVTGMPHWILVDEAHHLLPRDWEPAPQVMTSAVNSMIFVTVHPESLARAVLERLDVIAVMGEEPQLRIAQAASRLGTTPESRDAVQLDTGEALVWLRGSNEGPFKVRANPSTGERRRHLRKYAEGQLGEDRSFYFRGPEGRLNLRAQNLMLFMQLADGVDDSTWHYHLTRGDFSRWMRHSIKDTDLADDVESVEQGAAHLAPGESRDEVRKAIESRYTLAAEGAAPAGQS